MKKTFTMLFLCAIFALGALAQKPEGVIMKIGVDDAAPVLDGVLDDVWANANEYNIALPFQAEIPTLGAEGETTWRMLWDDNGVYVFLTVTDDTFWPNWLDPAGAEDYNWDKTEIYFDCNYLLEDGMGCQGGDNVGHHQYAPELSEAAMNGALIVDPRGYESAYLVDDPNYTCEYYVPWANLTDQDGVGVDKTGVVGFDVTIIDRDPGDAARKRAVWVNIGGITESWANMDDCGTIIFDGAESGTYIESISIEDVVVDENNGLVQAVATILPEDASNTNLKWTLTMDDGKATVDKGWVKGIIDGTGTLLAEATDGSYVDATASVTISNQIVSRSEINLIRNGYAKELNDAGGAAEWDGTHLVVENAIMLDPPAGGANYWDFTMTQQTFGCNTTDQYTFTFRAWATESDTFNVDFEDSNNGYNRYGSSNHALANGGESDWTFVTETVPTKYVFDVIFNEKVENTRESVQFMLGLHDPTVYIDSIELINDNDLALITDYEPVTDITVSSEGDATEVGVGATLQMSAVVIPEIADYMDVKWSVDNEEMATIDAAGLLTGVANGTVMVYASAVDDSEVMGDMQITVGVVGISEESAHTLMVYPNPAINELNVVLTSENTTVSIYNSVGKKMDEVLVSGTEHRFDISNYAYGVYFVKTDNAVTKFVK